LINPYFETALVRLQEITGHVNYTDRSLSREHFEFAARLRVRAKGRRGKGCACVYVSKCSWERPGSVYNWHDL